MGGGGSNEYSQVGYRARLDTVAEADDSAWLAPLNTSWTTTLSDLDRNFRIRTIIHAAFGGTSDQNATFALSYSHNGGSFTRVTPTSSVIKSVTSDVSGYDDDDDATQLISTIDSGCYIHPNGCIVTNNNVTGIFNWYYCGGFDSEVEMEWAVRLVGSDLKVGDTIELQSRLVGGGGGIIFPGGYTYSIIIYIQSPTVNIKGKEAAVDGKELLIAQS